MPKDEWRSANLRADFGPVRTKKQQKAKAKTRHRNRPRKKEFTFDQPRLTFGKHKGSLITEVPRSYLIWLVNQPPSQSWSMESLKATLRKYLQSTSG